MQIGRYQILDKLGSGGMGEVYRALARGVDGFQKPVVIKRIHKHLADRPDLAAQFINEAKIAMGLLHGNVVQVLDLGKIGEEYYIALEYVDGRDVRDVIRRCHELQEWIPQEISLYIIASVLGGLDYAHRRTDLEGERLGIIHRDVTPANILCSFEGEVKLADFGIARALAQHSDTMPGGVKGSLRYMSPEQAAGRQVDQRSDLFSVGVNLYYLLCGAHPYGEDNLFAVAERVRTVRFDSPSERGVQLPEELESIILTAMAADPDDRYPTAAAMQTALEGYQRSVAHATASDLRAFMQRIFDPESHRRSWSPPTDPLDAHDSLVGTEIEIGEEPAVSPVGAGDRLLRALRVEGVVPRVPTRSDPDPAPLQASPTASDSAAQGWGRSDLSASAHAETMLDLSSSGAAPGPAAPVARISGASRISAPPSVMDQGTTASASHSSIAGEASFREPSARSATDTVHLGRARGVLLVVGVAICTAGLAIGGFYLATRRGAARTPLVAPTPPGAQPAHATTGRLAVRSRPPGASVLLDGKPAGTAPVELQVALGQEHRLELRAAGREPWSEAFRLEAEAPRRTILVDLPGLAPAPRPAATIPTRKPPPPASAARGWVRVSTRPAWAEVHFGGRKIDVTPCRIQLPAGSQSLTLVNPALGKTERRRIVVRADREVELLITDFK